ncbi:MAG: hypothetical protein ABR564_05040 [Candidatus Dormibacteria bacterium]
MARLCAQLFTVLFAVLGVGGLFLGDAGSLHNGVRGGNFGGLALELTWWRDALDIALAGIFAYVGFVADRHTGRLVTLGTGALLLLLAAVGFVRQSAGMGPLRFPTAMNVLDLVTGILAVLCALGTIEEDQEPLGS